MDLKPQLIFENSHINLKLPYATPYLDPQLPSNVPQIPTIEGHKASIKGPLGGVLGMI